MVPWYPSPKEECGETNDVEDMSLSRKPSQAIKISYTGGGGNIIMPQIKYFTDKTRTIAKFEFFIKNAFGIATDTFEIDLVLPDACEAAD
jgi:hypothetical protein